MHIAVAGNIGSGKTSLVEKLAKRFGWLTEFELADENPYIQDFYMDMKKWSFHLQINFLISRTNQVKRISANPDPVIQDRTIYEDGYIFAQNLYKSGLINARDFKTYWNLYQLIISETKPPDLLIYLYADLPKLVHQIENRGKSYEKNISNEYLMSLNDQYSEWISSYNLGKLLLLDMNQINFIDNEEDFEQIINKIESTIF
ncbi:deoxynucleoside kinase [soil metagenome]